MSDESVIVPEPVEETPVVEVVSAESLTDEIEPTTEAHPGKKT